MKNFLKAFSVLALVGSLNQSAAIPVTVDGENTDVQSGERVLIARPARSAVAGQWKNMGFVFGPEGARIDRLDTNLQVTTGAVGDNIGVTNAVDLKGPNMPSYFALVGPGSIASNTCTGGFYGEWRDGEGNAQTAPSDIDIFVDISGSAQMFSDSSCSNFNSYDLNIVQGYSASGQRWLMDTWGSGVTNFTLSGYDPNSNYSESTYYVTTQ